MSDFQAVKANRLRACSRRIIDMLGEMTLGQGRDDAKADADAYSILCIVFSMLASHGDDDFLDGALALFCSTARTLTPLLRAERITAETEREARGPLVVQTTDDTGHLTGTVTASFTGQKLATPRGVVTVQDAPGTLTMQMRFENHESKIGLLVYDPEYQGGVGFMTQFDPQSAVVFGKALVDLAIRVAAEG